LCWKRAVARSNAQREFRKSFREDRESVSEEDRPQSWF